MIKKIKKIINETIKLQKLSFLQLKELEWAHIYHDSIRGIKPLEDLPLNIGRWAGNYTFFYIVNRILTDYKPQSILEFGLGESTKFISTFLEHYLLESNHIIVEHDKNWKKIFLNQFKLSNRSEIKLFDKVEKNINGFKSNCYDNIESSIQKKHDLYIIDGPFGSEHYSRYDIVNIAKGFSKKDEFIIIMDDYNRKGEAETTKDLLEFFKKSNIKIYKKVYIGNKSICVIATDRYRYATSL
jgi:hypothetical protein